MNNKGYAVLLVLAGMVCGILLVSLTSSPAAARLPDEGQVVAKPVPTKATTPTRPTRPVLARPDIRVYPAGVGVKNIAYAYVVKDGRLWYFEGSMARKVKFE